MRESRRMVKYVTLKLSGYSYKMLIQNILQCQDAIDRGDEKEAQEYILGIRRIILEDW
jgi:hypothetical protein